MIADRFRLDGLLDASQLTRIDQICLDFEQALLRGGAPRLEDYLIRLDATDSAAMRAVLFRELLVLEIDYRRRSGVLPTAGAYQSRFPEYAKVVVRLFCEPASDEDAASGRCELPAQHPSVSDTSSVPGGSGPSTSKDAPKEAAAGAGVSPEMHGCPPLGGRYEMIRQLGQGKFGTVYLAKDLQLDRPVAIKVSRSGLFSSKDIAARFLSEARNAARLKHPGIITIHDAVCDSDQCCIVMDYVEGGTLADPETLEKLGLDRVAELVARAADAVHFAHTQGFVHRDIKPANILVDAGGNPKVADFGLAIRESEQPGRKGEVSGTLHYMSPEQARGETDRLDGRTDIWSLGATLYELLTRRRPFTGGTAEELVEQILDRDVKPPRQINDAIPEEIERICLKALSKLPSARYSTAQDFARELRRAARAGKPAEGRRNWQLGWAVPCALAIVLAAVLAYVFWPPLRNGNTGSVGPPPPHRTFNFLPLHTFPDTRTHIRCAAVSCNGRYGIAGDEEGKVWIWDLEKRLPLGSAEMPASAWQVCVTDEGQVAALCSLAPYLHVTSADNIAKSLPLKPVARHSEPPETLVGYDGAAWAVLTLQPGLRLQKVDPPFAELPAAPSPWRYPVAGCAKDRVVVAGYAADRDEWRLKIIGPEPMGEKSLSGPVSSVAISDNGAKLAIGGWGPDLGVQVQWDENSRRLDDPGKDPRSYYHKVAISYDAEQVFAVSRYVPSQGSQEKEYTLLRAWSIDEGKEIARTRINSPVQAAAFAAGKRLIFVVVGQTVQIWTLAESVPSERAGD
jgi:WD40 repeat protein